MSCIQSENGGNAFKTSAESDLIADFISDSVIGLFRCSFASWLSSATWHVSGNLSLSWKYFRWEWWLVVVPDCSLYIWGICCMFRFSSLILWFQILSLFLWSVGLRGIYSVSYSKNEIFVSLILSIVPLVSNLFPPLFW